LAAYRPAEATGRPAFVPLPQVPLVPPGRLGATVQDHCLLGIQVAVIPGGIGAIFQGIMAPVAPEAAGAN